MSGVVVKFKAFLRELDEFLKTSDSPFKDSEFPTIEQERLDLLITALNEAVADKTSDQYVKASKINLVKTRAHAFLEENLQAIVKNIAPYCSDVLKYRHAMLPSVLNAIKYCKAVPGFVIETGQHFNEDKLRIMELCFGKPISELPEYFSKHNYQELTLQLKTADLFMESHINIVMRAEQKRQEADCMDLINATKPTARKSFAAGDFSDLLNPDLLRYYKERQRRYGLTPRQPHSAHAPSSTKVTVTPRKAQSARETSSICDGDNAESSERQKPFVPLLDLSRMQAATPASSVDQVSEQLEQCTLGDTHSAHKVHKRHRHKRGNKAS